jgi:hypothetical protein
VYDTSLYAVPDDRADRPRNARLLDSFRVDQYEYPPTFLLLPRALSALAPEFLRMRMLWYGLNGLVIVAGLIVVARQLKGAAAARAMLLVPFVLGAVTTADTLQKGNVQLLVIATSMIAMALVEARRPAPGGALLAFVTTAKLYPGLLVIYLLVRREWRALAWTTAFSALFVLLSLADVGWLPFEAFRHQLPGLMSGEAFPAFRNPSPVAINYSIPGLVFKLKLFGVPGMGFDAMHTVGTLYTIVAVAATVVLARRNIPVERRPLVWLAILILATLRSPFLPQSYATFPAIWLLTLLAAEGMPRQWGLVPFLAAWLLLTLLVPLDWGFDPRRVAIVSLAPQALMVALAVLVFRVTRERAPAPRTAALQV